MPSTDPIEAELRLSQALHIEAPERRRRAVKQALDSGWTKYRIAKLWGVRPGTIDAIVDTIAKNDGDHGGPAEPLTD